MCKVTCDITLRRRSDVALPRVLGGRGCPPLIHSASLDRSLFEKKIGSAFKDPRLTKSNDILNEEEEEEDPKQRFQSLVANASMKNAVTTVIRRASLEKQKTASAFALNTVTPSTPATTNNNVSTVKTQTSLDKKPFEDGVKMKISKELGQLRDQQNGVSASLEQIMDKVEQTKHEEEVDIKSNEKVREAVMTKIRLFFPNKQELGQRLRVTLAGFIFLVALFTVVMTMMPSSAKAMELFTNVRHQSAPPR
ncbi:hypothetical protein LOTGIDRAFT_162869 [Lottia gigantea]|uniref:Uncharacterized protein n=1 Tax=Lottia gigantea TaxID=225164 RepID=V4BSZ2_LOTGI|nr:hypothetical protein LOTGIDRAFT_162869 [Lottia gigantea]ESO92214.1 hypothetical protein LOTGIDRAFT_162869 [Lottia gigantea]